MFSKFLLAFVLFVFVQAEAQALTIIHRNNNRQLILQSDSRADLERHIRDLRTWKEQQADDAVQDPQIAQSPTEAGVFEVDITDLVPASQRPNYGTKPTCDGPNCWNLASHVAGLIHTLRHTHANEFSEILKNCRKRQANESLRPGDVGAIREVRSENDYAETHGFTYINDEMVYSKNGQAKEAPYLIQSTRYVLNHYGVPHTMECIRPTGAVSRRQCPFVVEYFDCSQARRPKILTDHMSMAQQLKFQLDQQISKCVMNGQFDSYEDIVGNINRVMAFVAEYERYSYRDQLFHLDRDAVRRLQGAENEPLRLAALKRVISYQRSMPAHHQFQSILVEELSRRESFHVVARRMAVQALVEFRGTHPYIQNGLAIALSDPDPVVRDDAFGGLVQMEQLHPAVQSRIIERILSDGENNMGMRTSLARLFFRLNPSTVGFDSALIHVLSDRDPQVDRFVDFNLSSLRGFDEVSRKRIAASLAKFIEQTPSGDLNPKVLNALCETQPTDPKIIRLLASKLQDPLLMRPVYLSLLKIKQMDGVLAAEMVGLLTSTNNDLRQRAAGVLQHFLLQDDEPNTPFQEYLASHGKDKPLHEALPQEFSKQEIHKIIIHFDPGFDQHHPNWLSD